MSIKITLDSTQFDALNPLGLPVDPSAREIIDAADDAAKSYCDYLRGLHHGLEKAAEPFRHALDATPTNWKSLEWDIADYFRRMANESPAARALTSKNARNALFVSAGGCCANCGRELEGTFHADHIIPWAKTGETNVHDMQALCSHCNYQKGGNYNA